MTASARHAAFAPPGPAWLHRRPVLLTACTCAQCVDSLRAREVAERSGQGAQASTTEMRSWSGGAACVAQKKNDVCVVSNAKSSSSGPSSQQRPNSKNKTRGVAKSVNIQLALFASKDILEQRSLSTRKRTTPLASGGARDVSFLHVTFVGSLHGPNKRSTRSRSWRSGLARTASKLARLCLQ